MSNQITRADVLRVVGDVHPDTITAENRAELSNKYSSEAVDDAKLGDMIWVLSRGVRGETATVVIRFKDADHVRAILSHEESDYRGPVSLENDTLLLHAESPAGEVYDLRTGRRLDPAGLPALLDAYESFTDWNAPLR